MSPGKKTVALVVLSLLVILTIEVGRAFGLVTISGSTATVTGKQTPGVQSGYDFACPPVTTLNIHSLTWMILPGMGDPSWTTPYPGVLLAHQAADGANRGARFWSGRDGGNGTAGSDLTINFTADPWDVISGGVPVFPGHLVTKGPEGHGVTAQSIAGNGGNGGGAWGAIFTPALGGDGGDGGDGGSVDLTVAIDSRSYIVTRGDRAHGIFALSQAGAGGNGGDAWAGVYVEGGDGGAGGNGGDVTVDVMAKYVETGYNGTYAGAHAILAQSLGGASGHGGDGGGLFGGGGSGSNSGKGGTVDVTNRAELRTTGLESHGVLAQSIGGYAGGGGGGGGLAFWGGSGASSGDGGAVTVTNEGLIETQANESHAIFGQSIGGGGGPSPTPGN
ncbi:MAG: hypothetical protein ACYTFQ_26595 [Planctomycetota bacterium]|jgi:hypothetical protein